ncbi:MAG: hypothetical protein ACRERE_20750 [Candidatus Entotheonellia bacterium]
MDDQLVQRSPVRNARRTSWYGLHRLQRGWWLSLTVVMLGVGCGQVIMQQILSSSVSIEAFEELLSFSKVGSQRVPHDERLQGGDRDVAGDV